MAVNGGCFQKTAHDFRAQEKPSHRKKARKIRTDQERESLARNASFTCWNSLEKLDHGH